MTKEQLTAHHLTAKNGFCLPYRMAWPEGEGPFPLLLCLHGAGERGEDNDLQVDYFLPLFQHPDSPAQKAVVLMPQCPQEMRWVEYGWDKGSYKSDTAPLSPAFEAVEELVAYLLADPAIDPGRVYVTGLSMGGFATWRMLAEHPDWFAAGMPICGGGPLDKKKILANLPIRTFHCADDTIVPVTATRDMVAAIETEGKGKLTYREYTGVGHGVWGRVYNDPDNVRWLFSQKK